MKVAKILLATLSAGLISIVTLAAPTSLKADDITYTVDQTLTDGSITGTIATDGTLGTLATADIVAWDLTSTVGASSQVLTPSDSSVAVSGPDLTATPTALVMDFPDAVYGYLYFQATSPASGYAIWVAGYKTDPDQGYIAADVTNNVGNETLGYVGSSQTIATATPEPGTSGLTLIGLALLGVVWTARKRVPHEARQQAS